MTDLTSGMKAYGEALFSLSEELGTTEAVLGDVRTLESVLKASPEYLDMLDSPALAREERLGLITKSIGTLDKNLVNMTKLLAEKRLCHALPKALEHYVRAYEISRGIERVEVISAVALSDGQKAKLKAKLSGITKKQIIISYTLDPSLLGGMKLRYMGTQLDGTLKTKLDGFAKSLSDLVI